MCQCNGTGVIIQQPIAGAWGFSPCVCEVSVARKAEKQARYAAWESELDRIVAEMEGAASHGD